MSLIRTVRNRTRTQYAANKIADRFAPSQTTYAAVVAGRNLVTLDGRTVPAAGVEIADIGSPVAIVNAGSPGLAAYSAQGGGIAVQFAGGGSSTGGGGMEVHDINSVWHTGTLADSQAPQFLKLDGSRQLTGNLIVASGITIDGIDISAHAADPDAHHAAATVGAGLGLTGQQIYLLTPGGLSVSSANSASGSHTHAISSSSNPGAAASILATSAAGAITLTGELQLTGTSASAQLRLRASTGGYDSYLWQNGATLQIDTESTTAAIGISTNGIVSLANRLRAPLIDTASGNLSVTPAGDLILDPGDSSVLPGGSIQDDLGDYNRKWRTLYAAELYVETLVAQDVLSTIGGRIMVAPTTTLIADVTSGATTIDVKHNNLTGAYVMLQTAPGGIAQFEVMRVTAGPTTITGGYRYTVTRNVDGTGANSWVSGDAVANLGASAGQGYIELTSTSTVHNHLGPTIAIYSRTGTGAWNDTKAVVALGNLRSFAGYSSDEFGLAVANDLTLTATTGFRGFVADRTNGVRLYSVPLALYNGATQTVNISATGADVWVGPSSADKRLSWDGTTLTVTGSINVTGGNAAKADLTNITGDLDDIPNGATYARVNSTLITGGNIRVGSGTKDSTLDGWHIDSGEIVGQLDGVDQVVLGTDGKIKAGAGTVTLSRAGLTIKGASSSLLPAPENRIEFLDGAGSQFAYIGAAQDTGNNILRLQQDYAVGNSKIEIVAAAGLSWPASIKLQASNASAGTDKTLTWTDTSAAPTFGGNTMWHAGNDGSGSLLDADQLDGYEATAFARLSASQTWTDTQYFSKSNGIGFDVRVDTSGVSKGFRIVTTGALATSTDTDQFQFYHAADNLWAMYSGDSSGYRGIVLNPSGGNVGIGTGTTAPAYKLEVSGTLNASGTIGGSWSSISLQTGVANYSGYAQSKVKKFGDLVLIVMSFAPNTAFPSGWLASVPSGYEPGAKIMLTATALGKTVPAHMSIATNGRITLENQAALGTDPTAILFTGIYSTGVS